MERTNALAPKVAGLIALAGLLLSSCLKTEKYPDEPTIKQHSFAVDNDTSTKLRLIIDFTDGDGDIGLDDSYDEPPFDTASEYYYNFRCAFEVKHNGEWLSTEQPYNYRLPVITPTGQNKSLDGEIEVTMYPFPPPAIPNLPVVVSGDTVRTQVTLVDRALHVSNSITTSELVLP